MRVSILPNGPIARILRFGNHFLHDRLTQQGSYLFYLGIFFMGLGSITLQIQVYLLFCLIAATVITSMICARLQRVPLTLRADLPVRTTCGTRLSVPLRARNERRRTAMDVFLRDRKLPAEIRAHNERGEFIGRLEPGQEVTLPRDMEFLHRGHYVLGGWQQETIYPWGLWRDLYHQPREHSLLVYPAFHPLINLDIPVGKRYQPGGIALSSNLGDSIEFIGTREFRQGDNPRAIHWKTWARIGKPAVKEFQEEYFCRVALLMDTFVPGGSKTHEAAFEAAISTAAAIADRLSHEEYVIDIFAAGPEIYYLQSGRSLAYLENVLDILACLQPCHEEPFEKISPLLVEHLDRITTTIVILLDWDERREQMCRTIFNHGSALKIVLVRDDPPSAEVAGFEGVTILSSADVQSGVANL